MMSVLCLVSFSTGVSSCITFRLGVGDNVITNFCCPSEAAAEAPAQPKISLSCVTILIGRVR